MEFLETSLVLIVTLSILITIHELGHFWVARFCGVKVLRFSVGFGKPLYTYHMKPIVVPVPDDAGPVRTRTNEQTGTEIVVAAIPLGGYVKMLDEREGYVADDELHLAFNRKPLKSRVAIVAAGPIANFLLAILCYWVLFATGVTGRVPLLGEISLDSRAGQAQLHAGQEIISVDKERTRTWSDVRLQLFKRIGDTGEIQVEAEQEGGVTTEHSIAIVSWLSEADDPYPSRDLGLILAQPTIPAVLGDLQEDGRALAAGLESGDQVVEVDGTRIDEWPQLVEVIQRSPEQDLSFKVLRVEEPVWLTVRPALVTREQGAVGYIGAGVVPVAIPAKMRRQVSYPVYTAWIPALEKTWSMTLFTVESLKKMVVGAISSSNLGGPITIAKIATASARSGLESYVGFIALLSISLGILNLFPIPILDGGHLLFYLYEAIRGKPIPERIQMLGLQVGIFFIVGVMVLAFYNDIARF